MSFAAVYNVTRALRMLLHSELVNVSVSATVTLLPPGDQLPAGSGVNLYLYRVHESPFSKNQPWRGDRLTPPSNLPALGLQLSYLLTPLGTRPDDASFQLGDDAHTMLGAAMTTLHENPILNNIHIPPSGASPGFDADTVLPDFLLNSYEQVKISLLPTGLEELSKIWATINQPYRLSVAYEVSLVELTPTPPPPVNAGIVLSTAVDVVALEAPHLESLVPSGGALVHVNGGGLIVANPLTLNGSGFSFPGQVPIVRVGGQIVTVLSSPAPTDKSLTVALPTGLDAGPQADVRMTLNGRTSIPLSFNVAPWLANVMPIRTALDPAQVHDLTLQLQGNGFTTSPAAVRFEGPGGTTTVTTFAGGGTDSQAKVAIPAGLANGIYNVRLVLGGPANNASNSRTLEVLPLVSAPIGLAVVTVSGKSVHRLTINGARLNGSDVRLLIDGITYQIGSHANAAQLIFTLGRLLDAGTHNISVNVDGHSSRTVVAGV
jgi:hypothetical protein